MTFAIDTFGRAGIGPTLPDRRQAMRIAAGVALSLAAHALLLATYRQPAASLSTFPPPRLTVRLRPVAPPPAEGKPAEGKPAETKPAEVKPTKIKPAETAPVPRARPPASTGRRVIAVTSDRRQSTDGTYAVKPAPETPPPASTPPHFDLDAARSLARGVATQLANEPDPDKVGTALERLPKPPLQTENKFERAIKAARRPDCKDGVPGGLLAPIFLALDKKDSGCKW